MNTNNGVKITSQKPNNAKMNARKQRRRRDRARNGRNQIAKDAASAAHGGGGGGGGGGGSQQRRAATAALSECRTNSTTPTLNASSPNGSLIRLGGHGNQTLPRSLNEADLELSMTKLPRNVRAYYRRQESLISDLLGWELKFKNWDEHEGMRSSKLHTEQLELEFELDTQHSKQPCVRAVIYGSFAVNVALFGGKVVAAIVTSSMALTASALDSALDLFSGLVLFLTSWIMNRSNPYQFPAGKSRLEPIGIIIFSSVMGTATLFVIIEAAKVLLDGETELTLTTEAILFLAAVILSKMILFVAAYCTHNRCYSNRSVEALYIDHRNDVLSNSLVAIVAIVVGYVPEAWFLDAVCAIAVSIFIIFVWGRLAYQTMAVLSGKTAPVELLNKLTYLCLNHRPDKVLAIDTVRAFHLSYGFVVEVDILLPQDMFLHEAHDIGEELQFKLERLEEVERAFVHLDHEIDHEPEHKPMRLPYHLQKKMKKKSRQKTPTEK